MLTYIKDHSLNAIKNKFILLYSLNVTDIIFTIILIKIGISREANFLMVNVVYNYVASFLLKIVLPAVLFVILFYRMQKATEKQLKSSNYLINGAIISYSLINIVHLATFVLLLVLNIYIAFI